MTKTNDYVPGSASYDAMERENALTEAFKELASKQVQLDADLAQAVADMPLSKFRIASAVTDDAAPPAADPVGMDGLEQLAIKLAKGNNGGEWASHYTEAQKEGWRKFAREILEYNYAASTPPSLSTMREALVGAQKVFRQLEAEMRAGLGSSYGETREQVRRAAALIDRELEAGAGVEPT